MSRSKVRHGHWVYEAAMRVCEQKGGWHRAIFTIGEIAQQCDLSRPTIKRYLDAMVDYGSMSREKFGTSLITYQFVDDGKGK